MPTYIVLNKDGQSKSYTCKTTHTSQPYVKVSDKFLDLTTNLGTGLQMLVKKNGKTYVPVQTVTTTASRSSEYTETTGYSGVTSSEYSYNVTYGSSFRSITSTRTRATTSTTNADWTIATSNGKITFSTESYSKSMHASTYKEVTRTSNVNTNASSSTYNLTAVASKYVSSTSYFETYYYTSDSGTVGEVEYWPQDNNIFSFKTTNYWMGGYLMGLNFAAKTSKTSSTQYKNTYSVVPGALKATVNGYSYTRTFSAKRTATGVSMGNTNYSSYSVVKYSFKARISGKYYSYYTYYSKLTSASTDVVSNTNWVGVITNLTYDTTSQVDYYTSSTDQAQMSSTTALTQTSSRSSTYETITEG